jgi:hypothetical protein
MKALITENQFKKLKTYLNEISVQDAYAKYYNDISQDDYSSIIEADPFSKPNFLSPYAKWLLGLYKNKNLKLEDLYKATEYITTFNTIKPRLSLDKKDINKFKSLPDMFNVIKPYMESGENIQSSTSLEKEIKQKETKKIYEDDKWLVIEPLTERSACYYGKNTQWCTAAKENNYFDDYNKQGPLYINIDKVNNEKYQFHFESGQFMDENDRDINLMEFIDKNQSLRNFYNEFLKDKVKNVNFEDMDITNSGCYLHVKDWSYFRNVFEQSRHHKNPADFLNDFEDSYYDNHLYSEGEIKRDYFDDINESNKKIMIDFLIKNQDITSESSDDEIKDEMVEFFVGEIGQALSWAYKDAAFNAAYENIVGEIKDFFGVTNITYQDDRIYLKLNKCPEPIILLGIGSDWATFINGYCEKFGKIDYNYPNYGFDGNIDLNVFNEYLTDNLHGM